MGKVLNKLNEELKEREKKYHDNLNIVDVFIISISLGMFIFTMTNDSQVYFYTNYGYLSLIVSIFTCIVLYYFLRKKKISKWYYLFIPILVITLALWIIPKALHYTVLPKKSICLDSTITHKYWHRYGNAGYIEFSLYSNSKTPKELLHFDSLSNLDKYDYDLLPSKGEQIKICGNISKVGYTYTYIESVK